LPVRNRTRSATGSGERYSAAPACARAARGRAFIAGSVLDPIHFGLSRSLARYVELRDRYPGIEIMMGTGNVSS